MLVGILRSKGNMWVSLPSFITILAEQFVCGAVRRRCRGCSKERHSHAAEERETYFNIVTLMICPWTTNHATGTGTLTHH